MLGKNASQKARAVKQQQVADKKIMTLLVLKTKWKTSRSTAEPTEMLMKLIVPQT